MVRSSISKYRKRVYSELEAAFKETHTPHEIAGSFSIGVFVTTIPSVGLGLVLFLILARLSDRISRIAIFSSAFVINPFVKAPMFVAAFWIGSRVLGPIDSVPGSNVTDATVIAVRMITGFVVLGILIAVVGYIVVYILVTEYRKRDVEIVETIIDDDLLAK